MHRLLPLLVCLIAAGPAQASPQQAVLAAEADAAKLPREIAYRTRYLWTGNIVEPRDRDQFHQVLDGWTNHLSREADIAKPRRVCADVLAVILDDYGWSEKVWDAQRVDPYFHRFEWVWFEADAKHAAAWWKVYYPARHLDPQAIKRLSVLTQTKTPIIRADWWLFYSSRQIDLANKAKHGFGYLDWLQLKKRDDVDQLASVDRKKSIKLGRELRALIEQGRSGIAQLDRQIEWYATYGDGEFGYWITLDTFDATDNTAPGNLQRGTFKHQAEEILFGLPNGHVGMFLGDDGGKLQETAPDKIGGNETPLRVGRDLRIHVGQCFHCHRNGMLQSVDDWARRELKSPAQLEEKDYKRLLELKRQLFGDLDGQLAKGRARYEAALQKSCGLKSGAFAEAHAKAYYRYQYGERTVEVLAVEIGTDAACLKRALARAFDKNNARLPDKERRRLAGLIPLLNGRGIPITTVEASFDDLLAIVQEYGK